MPVRYTPGGNHHERKEYSYYTRDLGPHNFARSRRFVEEDGEESRTMSLVSNPLQVPMIGRKSPSPNRRPMSPQEMYHQEHDVVERDWEESRGRFRQAPRRNPRGARGNRNPGFGYDYEFEDSSPMQPLVPTYQPRRNRMEHSGKQQQCHDFRDRRHAQYLQAPDFQHHPDSHYESRGVPRYQRQFEDEGVVYQEDHDDDYVQQPQPQKHQDHEIQSVLNWRKRPQKPLVHTDFGYEVPTMRKRADPLSQDAEDNYRAVTGYLAKRRQFAVENDDDVQHYRNPNYQYRIHGIERPLITAKDLEESIERHKIDKAPMFEMKLRSHVVWEKMNVKFTCTVRGSPTPRVTWYKDMVPLEPSLHTPGKYKISHQFGLHTLEICRAAIEDSGTYRVSLQNRKGEISSYATLLVRRYDGGKMGVVDVRSGYNMRKPTDYPDVQGLNVPGYPRFVVPLFGKTVQERDAVVITCKVEASPPPEVFWTLNGRTIEENSTHIKQSFDGFQATLIILKVFTDDEGEYCCRAFNSCGAATSRCYIRVSGIESAPSAPCSVDVIESTRDYVMLSWRAPGYIGHFGGAPIEGYFIETCEAGSCLWKTWNINPITLTTSPVTGLDRGKAYFFRVRSANRWGKSPPSLSSCAVGLRDPGTPRLPEELADPSTLLPPVIEELDGVEGKATVELPPSPTSVSAVGATDNEIVITWAPSDIMDAGPCEGYLIESKEENSDEWKLETSLPLKTIHPYPISGLESGKAYKFRVFSVNSSGCSLPMECPDFISLTEKNISPSQVIVDSAEQCQETVTSKDTIQVEDSKEISQSNIEETCTEESQMTAKKDTECDNADKLTKNLNRPKEPSAPIDVKELQATREFISIGWTPPFKTFGQDPSYYVEMKDVESDNWKICNQSPIGLTHFPIVGVTAGCTYIFRVRAVTEFGTSPFSLPSEAITATDRIKPPNWWGGVQGIFRVSEDDGKPAITKSSIKVCWDPPTTDGGSSITGYYLEYRPAGGKFKPVNNKPLMQRHFTADGLKPGVEYEFRVCACNIAGSGDWKILPRRILAKDPEPPVQPTDLLVTLLDEESVSLKWKKPLYKGDAEMIGYVVERCKENSDIWIPCNKLPENIKDEKYKVDGLVTGQTYFFRVRAVNKVGQGEPSLSSCFVTPGEDWELVVDRQNAMIECRRRKYEEELALKRALEEEERREAFLIGIEDCSVAIGRRAYFESTVKDSKTEVKWCYGNDKEIELQPVGNYDIIQVGNKRSLIISNCQYEDIQLVHCIALYNNCTTSACCIVDELEPVVFISKADDIHINSGQTATFSYTLCRENAKVTWYKNGVEIDENDDRFEIVTDRNKRSLTLRNATIRDCATYTVSGYGGSDTSHLVVDGVLPAYFSDPISGGEYAYDEGVAEIECTVVPSALYKDGNEPLCIWYHNGDRLEEGDDKYEIIKQGNKRILKILNLNHEDSGEIVCKCGGDESRCEIDVERPPPPPPKLPELQQEDLAINFVQGLRSEALIGSIRLYCVLEKLRDDVKIIWYRDDVEMELDKKEFKNIVDRESAIVSLIFNEPTAELGGGTYTCEFITSHSIFDTKVNFTFAEGEFANVMKAAAKLKEQEDEERRLRLEERRRIRAELRKRRENEEQNKRKTTSETAVKEKTQETSLTCGGIEYGVDKIGQIVLCSEVSGLDENAEVVWMKDNTKLESDRHVPSVTRNTVELTIKEPIEYDLGTYTCRIKTATNSAEMSIDITGKVFDDLLLKSMEIRQTPGKENGTNKAKASNIQTDSEDLVTVLRHENEINSMTQQDDDGQKEVGSGYDDEEEEEEEEEMDDDESGNDLELSDSD